MRAVCLTCFVSDSLCFVTLVQLSMYDGHRYEVECKYTQFVEFTSRPVWPRLDMTPLAAVLNTMEVDLDPDMKWGANRFTDTGVWWDVAGVAVGVIWVQCGCGSGAIGQRMTHACEHCKTGTL